MTEVIDRSTGEIATVDPSSELAVTSYLQQARDWLATAVETTGPEQIARAKAEIATAAEAGKQLGLSKEIQDDAQEMVRRAEYALGKAIRKGQAEGTVAKPTDTLRQNRSNQKEERASTSPDEFTQAGRERHDVYRMSDLEAHEFEDVLSEAKESGNLSRSNVSRLAQERAGRPQRATRRAPLTDFAFEASTDLLKVAERLSRVLADDRFKDNRDAIQQQAGGQINRAIELIAQFSTAIKSETTP